MKWAYVVSGDGGTTIVKELSGGLESFIKPSLTVPNGRNRAYPIQKVLGIVLGLLYRIGSDEKSKRCCDL